MSSAILQTMGEQKSTKINLLQDLLEEGLLAPTGWLEEQGYSRALISRYVDSGWLVSPARGVYRRPGPSLKWQHVVASLQLLAGSYLHVGGRTALVQRGLGHYIRMSGPETINLYGPEVLPAWVNKLGLQERFAVRNDAMFGSLRARRNELGALVDFHDVPLQSKQLADFGLLTEADHQVSRLGTLKYMPPDGRMDTRADVYAAGLVICYTRRTD